MASVKETSKENIENQLDDDDIRGDGKKKKFKPLSAVRKFFGGKKRKKEDGVVAVKAQSTTALHSTGYDEDEENDDGGFKSHQKSPKPLVGTRSISEDSIFSPEVREQPPTFSKVAVSEESLPKSSFQSELFTKLNKRRSLYSDDDQDEGIPRSPVPIVTTADVVAEPLKPLTFGKKQSGSTRDSEQSLISVDGSDMEDDLFTSKWKAHVPSRKSAETPRMSDSSDLESMDFSSIEKTEVLKSTAARDRISIKPQYRRASRLSRKKKESSLSKSLPCLNEELSPTRPTYENLSKTTRDKNAVFDDINVSQLDAKAALPIATGKVADPAPKSLSSSAPGKSQDITRIALSSNNTQTSNVVVVKEKDGHISPKDKEKKVAFTEEYSSPAKAKSSNSGGGSGSPSLKVSDPDSGVTMSPREDYKLKRQNRSKTLPHGSTEEDTSSKIQRASSHRAPATSSPQEETPASIAPSSSVKKLGATRFSQFESSNASSEPSWVNKAKQKKVEQSESEEIDTKKQSAEGSMRRKSHENVLASVKKSSEPATHQTKHVPSSSSSSKDSKTDSNTSKVIETEKDKKADVLNSSNLNSKRASIDIASTKRESIDIDIKELSSIKQRTASFNTAGKTESTTSSKTQESTKIKSPTTSTTTPSSTSTASLSMSERAKLFSGANSSSSNTSTTASNSSKPPAGIGHLRSGSVKTSPTKSSDSNTPVSFRPGSVKGTSFSSSTGASSLSSSNKSDSSSSQSSSTAKRETSESNAVTKPSNLAASANTKISSPNTKVSTPSSSSQQTPSSLKSSPSTASPTSSTPSSVSKTTLPKGRAFSSFSSVAKPPINSSSSASASNVSKPNQPESSSSSSVPTSSPPPSSTTSPASNSAKPSSKTQSSPIKSHASFSATSPFRPLGSSNSPSLSSRTTALSKSTSMKVSSPAPSVTKIEEKKKEPTTTPSSVPAWRANLQKSDNVKIEIIEKKSSPTSSTPSSQSSQSKNENVNKFGNSSRVTEMAKKSDSNPTIEKAAASSSNRSSKVLDMVKNFQNLQVST